jgi:hypothetical protein
MIRQVGRVCPFMTVLIGGVRPVQLALEYSPFYVGAPPHQPRVRGIISGTECMIPHL